MKIIHKIYSTQMGMHTEVTNKACMGSWSDKSLVSILLAEEEEPLPFLFLEMFRDVFNFGVLFKVLLVHVLSDCLQMVVLHVFL